MEAFIEITWYGRGGQGVVTASKVLAETALAADWFFQSAPEYGPERAGAPIKAFTRLSDAPISLHTGIQEPNIVIVLDPTVIGPLDVTAGLRNDGCIIVNTPSSPAELRKLLALESGHVATVDATQIAIDEVGRDVTNTALLGAFARVTGVFGVDQIIEQTRSRLGKKLATEMVEANVRAIRRAAEKVRMDPDDSWSS